jgi:NADH-quinone oxidoreductase subunit E/NADP-reducing hydrogenase subunit HndA
MMAEHMGRILVVDDELVVLKGSERVLRPEGYEVDAVPSPLEGLEKFEQGGYDLVITDIMMPEMDGLEFIRRIRQKSTDINIVMITGFPSQESIKEALGLRIVDYLPKPFSPALLLEVVGKAMAVTRSGTAPEPGVEDYNEEVAEKLDALIEKFRGHRGPLIPLLEETQELIGYLPPVVLRHVARGLGLPVAEVHGVVSFYHFFTMKPKGKHNIKVCTGTACYVKRADEIVSRLSKELGIEMGGVTEDRQFSMESVRCLGACGLAPVVVIGQETHGSINPVETHKILDQYRGNGGSGDA